MMIGQTASYLLYKCTAKITEFQIYGIRRDMQSDKCDQISDAKKRVQMKMVGGKQRIRNFNRTEFRSGRHLSIIDLLEPFPVSVPVPARNYYGMTGDLSLSNKLLNAFLDSFRWLELL